MDPEIDLAVKRKRNPFQNTLNERGLYHSFRLSDGRVLNGLMPLDLQEGRIASLGLPADLSGKRVLDIGPWDGYFSFEMERRGAAVTAIDYVDLDTFRALHRAMNSRVEYRRMDVYELDPERDGPFDIVLCLGVLYHLKHPLLALEKICAVTLDRCLVDTFVTDGEAWSRGERPPIPSIEFYERDQLRGQLDNWCGPSVSAVASLIRSAGFASADLLNVSDAGAIYAAHRHWAGFAPGAGKPVELTGINCHSHRGKSFESRKEQYLALWCNWPQAPAPDIESVYPEIDGFGVAPLSCSLGPNGLLVSVRVPPGLRSGAHTVRLRMEDFDWSQEETFYVDLPNLVTSPSIISVQDGVSWVMHEVDWIHGGWLTLWTAGLSPEADPGNTIVEVGGVPHFPESVYPEGGQVNVQLRPMLGPGAHEVRVWHRGKWSRPVALKIIGQPPPIRGLECLAPDSVS